MSVRKAIFDTMAVSFVSVARLLAQFLAIPILSRILSPAEYGVVAMAMPFILFAMMIADAGIGMSLVRTPCTERAAWSTCFWLSALLGAGLAAIMMVLAPFFAFVMEEQQLTSIVMVLALVVFIQSLSSIPNASLQQEQKFRLIAVVEVFAVASGIAVAVVSALHGAGAWALVLQQLVFYVLRGGLNFWFASFRPGRMFDLGSVREHLTFGRDVLGVNIITFFTRSVDNLVVGKILGAAAVGVYSMAFQFARLPIMLVTGPLQYVFYSKLLRVKDDTDAIRVTFLLLTRILAIVVFPSMGMLAAAYHPVFTVLLSEKWVDSGYMFMLVAAASAVQAVTGLCGTIRMVLGRTDYQLRATIETGVMWVAALLSSVWFGLHWVGIAYSVAFVLYSPRSLSLALPLIGCSMGVYARTVAVPLVATLICTAIFMIWQQAMQPGDWMQLGGAALLCAAAMVAGTFAQRRALLAELRVMHYCMMR